MESKKTNRNATDSYAIRRMEVEDLDRIFSLAATDPYNVWSKEMFLGEMAHPLSHCFIIYGKDDFQRNLPLGFVCFRNIEGESELLNICVHPEGRRKGLGRKLMEFYIAFCHQKGVRKYYLEVPLVNLPALRLYESFAFRPVGKREKFYQGKFDAVLMER